MKNDPDVVLETARLRLALPRPDAAASVAAYFLRNREHHGPWDAPRAESYYVEDSWRERLAKNRSDYENDVAMRLFLFPKEDGQGEPAGTVSLTPIARGPFQACMLGYALDSASVGKGLMREALGAVVRHAFGPLALHRIMANYVPENVRSARVLRALGFVVEGHAREYLFIGGKWRDHVLTALTNPEPSVPPTAG